MKFLPLFLLLFVAPSAWAQPDPALLSQLRQGGFVLYMRHALTDMSKNDAKMTNYDDCANQRNLTDQGRAEARAVGAHIKRLGIPIGDVVASPFCRTMETARLAYGQATPTEKLRALPGSAGDAKRFAPLKELLSTVTPGGRNLVAVGHAIPFHAVAGPPFLEEGEIAAVRPEGSGFTVVGRIRVEHWKFLQ